MHWPILSDTTANTGHTHKEEQMTIAQTIAQAREHLAANNEGAFKRLITASIRSATSTRTANVYRRALADNGYRLQPSADWDNPTETDVYLWYRS